MHRVISGQLKSFNEKFEINEVDTKSLEAFVNYILLREMTADNVSPSDLIYEGDDPGIDGVMIFLDDQYVSSPEEIEVNLKGRRRDVTATILFTQVKSGENWVKHEINTFKTAIEDFLRESPIFPMSDYLRAQHDTFNALVENVGRLSGGRPNCSAFFATTGQLPEETSREIWAAKASAKAVIEDTGLFGSVDFELVGRDGLLDRWNSAEGAIETTLSVLGMASFPRSPKIEEGYVVTARAKDFVDSVLSDEKDKLRTNIFDENVRAYIGADNDVNTEIISTIESPDRQKRFGVLNNGITIISPDVRVQGTEVFLKDFQIVNGCQTSNILFAERDRLTDDATLMLKIIETDDAGLIDEIVRSTNRQSKVQDEQFLATLDAIKAIERFFEARGADEEHRLYFERRTHQFADEDVKAIRVFDIKEVARASASMFLHRPDLASRYPNRLTGEMRDLVFSEKYKEEIYYSSSYCLYRLLLVLSNNRIDRSYRRFRWHILMAAYLYIEGGQVPSLNKASIRGICDKLEAFFEQDDAKIEVLSQLCSAAIPDLSVPRDELRTQSFVSEVRDRVLAHRSR